MLGDVLTIEGGRLDGHPLLVPAMRGDFSRDQWDEAREYAPEVRVPGSRATWSARHRSAIFSRKG